MLREELELNIDSTFLWTDSELVLHYPKNEKRRLQTFVAHRVEEIKEQSTVHDWNHVSGTLNPADYVPRGLTLPSLTADHSWLRRPDFLWGPEHPWPKQECRTVPREDLELYSASVTLEARQRLEVLRHHLQTSFVLKSWKTIYL